MYVLALVFFDFLFRAHARRDLMGLGRERRRCRYRDEADLFRQPQRLFSTTTDVTMLSQIAISDGRRARGENGLVLSAEMFVCVTAAFTIRSMPPRAALIIEIMASSLMVSNEAFVMLVAICFGVFHRGHAFVSKQTHEP